MRFTQDLAATQLIHGYRPGELLVNGRSYRGALIVSATDLIHEDGLRDLEGLLSLDAARILALQPEIVLLGTGDKQLFPPPTYVMQFLSRGVGFEAMDTGAACRTYNVLVSEQRRVVAMLLA
jgi:uncharacterized protein